MSTLFRRIQRSLPMKISLNMFFIAVLVFLLVNGIFGALSRRHFHTVAMDKSSRILSTAVDSARHYLQSLSQESLQELSKALFPLKPYPNSYFMILDKDGRYLMHRDSAKIGVKTIFAPTNGRYYPDKITLGHEMTAGHSGRMHAKVANVLCLICYEPIEGTGLSAALVSPERDVLHRYWHLR